MERYPLFISSLSMVSSSACWVSSSFWDRTYTLCFSKFPSTDSDVVFCCCLYRFLGGEGGVNYTWSCESNLRNRNCHFKQVMSIEEYLPYLHQLVDLGGKNEPSICHLAGGKNVEVSWQLCKFLTFRLLAMVIVVWVKIFEVSSLSFNGHDWVPKKEAIVLYDHLAFIHAQSYWYCDDTRKRRQILHIMQTED